MARLGSAARPAAIRHIPDTSSTVTPATFVEHVFHTGGAVVGVVVGGGVVVGVVVGAGAAVVVELRGGLFAFRCAVHQSFPRWFLQNRSLCC